MIGFPGRIDFGKHRHVGQGQRFNEIIEQRNGTTEGMGLKYANDPFKVQFLCRRQGGLDLCGMMGVIIHDQCSVNMAEHFKPAFRSGEAFDPLLDIPWVDRKA
ncbi:hypothetical protein SDC9_209996 [bioreactor metagenome]|uniref:Uncharacterized protein n=1 Tax=bioreactor metagenome TaxID=1076179 RepID=A0A645JHS1_9ZZZZ